MSVFTTTVRKLRQHGFDFGLGPTDYPIFDERLRGRLNDDFDWDFNIVSTPQGGQEFYGLNRRILDNYEYLEIGMETPDMWRFALNRRLREIMPYYNQLYASAAVKFDPFQTLDTVHETDVAENTVDAQTTAQDSTGTTTNDAKSRNVGSTMPQTRLAGNEDYASSAADVNSQTEAETTARATGNTNRQIELGGNTKSRYTGSQGHTAALLMQWRRAFLNIDMMIVNDLADLFMMVSDNNDSHTNQGEDFYNGTVGFGFPYFRSGI